MTGPSNVRTWIKSFSAPSIAETPIFFTAKADGTASVTLTLPSMPTHDNAVLVIYNSGGQPHGMERGRIGVDAHHQIIARPE